LAINSKSILTKKIFEEREKKLFLGWTYCTRMKKRTFCHVSYFTVLIVKFDGAYLSAAGSATGVGCCQREVSGIRIGLV